ncbi:MAG: Outer membrane porin protein [Xylophilus sp.]|nr:MAG: Outer membrane porin protein [Xylophilus sp.]
MHTVRFLSASALLCAAACAHAQSSVSIYGMLDVGIVRDSGIAGGGSVLKVSSGVFNGSRLGFRGNEDLGGGLSAIYTMEMGFQADTGALGQGGLAFGRQVFVGLSSKDYGALKFGRQYSAIDQVVGNSDPFGSGGAGRNASLVAARFVNGTKSYYNNRINNSVMYTSPVINGFSGDMGYGFGESVDSTHSGRYVGASIGYAQGPLYARLASQDIVNAAGNGSVRNSIFGASYNFGPVTGYFSYSWGDAREAGVRQTHDSDVLLGVAVPVSASGRVIASYVAKNDKLAANRDANLVAIGYLHDLSKRTTLYASGGRIHNKNGAGYSVNTSIDVGPGTRSADIGIRHTF